MIRQSALIVTVVLLVFLIGVRAQQTTLPPANASHASQPAASSPNLLVIPHGGVLDEPDQTGVARPEGKSPRNSILSGGWLPRKERTPSHLNRASAPEF